MGSKKKMSGMSKSKMSGMSNGMSKSKMSGMSKNKMSGMSKSKMPGMSKMKVDDVKMKDMVKDSSYMVLQRAIEELLRSSDGLEPLERMFISDHSEESHSEERECCYQSHSEESSSEEIDS